MSGDEGLDRPRTPPSAPRGRRDAVARRPTSQPLTCLERRSAGAVHELNQGRNEKMNRPMADPAINLSPVGELAEVHVASRCYVPRCDRNLGAPWRRRCATSATVRPRRCPRYGPSDAARRAGLGERDHPRRHPRRRPAGRRRRRRPPVPGASRSPRERGDRGRRASSASDFGPASTASPTPSRSWTSCTRPRSTWSRWPASARSWASRSFDAFPGRIVNTHPALLPVVPRLARGARTPWPTA